MLKTPVVASAATRNRSANSRFADSLAIAAVLACIPSFAQAADNWYARADVGYSFGGSADIDASAPIEGDASLDGNILGAAGIGYAFDNGWRVEGELARRENDFDPLPLLDQGGAVGATSVMLNAYYDFGRGDGRLTPYVGAGIGVAKVQLEAANIAPLSPVSIDDEATTIAYQVMAGVAINLAPRLDLDLGYRFFSSPSIEGTGAAPPVLSFPFEADLSHHAVTAGLRWKF